jgi:putative molybdopterin biosynthesis protein
LVLLGSDDLALNLLAQYIRQIDPDFHLVVLPVGSLDGLVALRQGLAQLSGCHLLDWESGEYNRSYVRHFFPDSGMVLVTLAHREQGLLVLSGNPLRLRNLEDLSSQKVRFINRNKGSGTRLWLDRKLQLLGIPGQQIPGYSYEVATHNAVANAIVENRADTGLALAAAAVQHGLDFIPLFQERYDLVVPVEQYTTSPVQTLLEHLGDSRFRKAVDRLGGYRTEMMGVEVQVGA